MAAIDLQDRLDEIYGGDPAKFTSGRDALAKELKAADEGELAAEVKKLKRPTKAAATINRLSLEHAGATARVLESGTELRAIQENLSKAGAGEKLRAASAEHREAIDGALAVAESELDASGQVLDRIGETLQATASNEGIAEAVRTGRLEREGQAAGLGEALVATGGRGAAAKAAPAKPKSDKAAAAARRKRRTAEAKLEKAEAKLEAAVADEADAADRLRDIEKELRAAKATHDGAEKKLARARDAADRARRDLEALDG